MSAPYNLPAHLSAALFTGRPELLAAGGPLPTDEATQRELLRLLADLIKDRQEARERETELRKRIQDSVQNIIGAALAIEELAP